MTMHWPQIVMMVLIGADIGLSLERHGKPKEGTNSFFTMLIADAIMVVILFYGGFWSQP